MAPAIAGWAGGASEAAGAIMVGAVAARAGGRGPLRNDLEVACPDLSLDELALLSARALDSASRLRVAPGALDVLRVKGAYALGMHTSWGGGHGRHPDFPGHLGKPSKSMIFY